jgi:hypothetical protein
VAFSLDAKLQASARVGPEDTPFRPQDFGNVRSRLNELESEGPESGSRWMPDPVHGWTPAHERLQDSKLRKIRGRAFRKAMSEAIDASPANKRFVAYCGWPVDFDGDEVLIILQLQKDVHDEYYHLKRGHYRDRSGLHEYRLDRSLIEAIALKFLWSIAQELKSERPSDGLRIIDDLDDLIRKAANSVMTPAAAAGGNE